MSGTWWQWRGRVPGPASQGAARPQVQSRSESTGGSRSIGDQSTPLQLNTVTVRPIAIQEDEFESKGNGDGSIGLETTPRNHELDDDADPQGIARRLFDVNSRPFVPSTSTSAVTAGAATVGTGAADLDRQAER